METTYDRTDELLTSGIFWFKVLIVISGLTAIAHDLILWAPK